MTRRLSGPGSAAARAQAAALRAEARAWRKVARAAAENPDAEELTVRVRARWTVGIELRTRFEWHLATDTRLWPELCLASLFLALECEDEAHQIERGLPHG